MVVGERIESRENRRMADRAQAVQQPLAEPLRAFRQLPILQQPQRSAANCNRQRIAAERSAVIAGIEHVHHVFARQKGR